MFEEYSQMDISSGIPEQIEVLELVDKAEMSRTSDEARKKIEKGFETLDGLKDFHMENDNFDRVPDELKKVEKSFHLNTVFTDKHRDIIEEIYSSFSYYRTHAAELIQMGKEREHVLDVLIDVSVKLSKYVPEFKKFIEGLSLDFLSFDPIEVLKSSMEELIPVIDKIKVLENLGEDLTTMESEIKVLEEFRDSTAPEKIQNLTKKLENTVDRISVKENVQEKYQKIGTASELLQKISLFSSFLSTIKWKFAHFKKQWIPVEEYLNSLKIPSEDLSKPFVGLRDCISQHEIDSSPLQTEKLDKIAKQFKKLYSLQREFKDLYDMLMKHKDWEAFRNDLEVRKKHLGNAIYKDEEWDKFINETVGDIDVMKLRYMNQKIEPRGGRPGKRHDTFSFYEASLIHISQASKNVDVQAAMEVTNNVKLVIDKIDQFLKCYSDLKVTPETIKSLMDKSLEAWNFDARPLESVLAVIDLFKDAHKMIGGLTSWKFEQNDVIKHFPLTREDVTGISEGVEALEAIMKVQSGWRILRESMEDSDEKDALIKFSEELSHLGMDPKIPEIQELLSKIQFPKDFDTVIDFYKNRYPGNRRREILKILEVFKTMDFPSYPSKLEKMNQAIGTMRKWAELQEKGGDQEDEEKPWVDCALSTCKHVLELPESPEEPV